MTILLSSSLSVSSTRSTGKQLLLEHFTSAGSSTVLLCPCILACVD